MVKVRCQKIFFEYKHKNILRDINLNIDDGQILKYDDFVVNEKKVGFAPANNSFQRNISAKDILFYQAFITKLNYQKANELIPKVLKYFDLTEHAHKSFAKFSSGMKKKFLLALSLINDPNLLILDEPTANLDPETRKQVCELIFKLHQRNPKITIIIASHILSELESLINYVVILEEGQILCSKNFNYQQEDLEKLYYDHLKKVQKEPEEKEFFLMKLWLFCFKKNFKSKIMWLWLFFGFVITWTFFTFFFLNYEQVIKSGSATFLMFFFE